MHKIRTKPLYLLVEIAFLLPTLAIHSARESVAKSVAKVRKKVRKKLIPKKTAATSQRRFPCEAPADTLGSSA
jgi:hypothetical protein